MRPPVFIQILAAFSLAFLVSPVALADSGGPSSCDELAYEGVEADVLADIKKECQSATDEWNGDSQSELNTKAKDKDWVEQADCETEDQCNSGDADT